VQLGKFCAVGVVGYAINLVVYTTLINHAGVHYLLASICAFFVAVTNNYWWNRVWTFRGQRGHVAYQGLQFLVVSTMVLGVNLLVLQALVSAGVDKVGAQRVAVVVATPLNFLGNKLWSFRHRDGEVT
jgi:putative flippase GtrA